MIKLLFTLILFVLELKMIFVLYKRVELKLSAGIFIHPHAIANHFLVNACPAIDACLDATPSSEV